MGWPDGHTIVANWNGKGNPPVTPYYHREADGLAGRPHDRAVEVIQSLDTKAGGADDNEAQAGHLIAGGAVSDDALLPLGLDSHRYRCCGNGVVAPVAEWLGRRIAEALT